MNTVANKHVSQEELGSAKTYTSGTGVAHLAFDNDIIALKKTRELWISCHIQTEKILLLDVEAIATPKKLYSRILL